MIFLPLNQCDNSAGSVVPISHARGKSDFILTKRAQYASGNTDLAVQDTADHLSRYPPGTKDNRITMAEIKHCGFNAHVTHSAVNNQGNLSVHIFQHMGRSCRTRTPGAVGGGCGDRKIAGLQHCTGDRMRRHAYSYGRKAGCYLIGNCRLFGTQYRQGPRPESVHQRKSAFRDVAKGFKLPAFMDMDNQRIIRRTSFCRKNGQYGTGIKCIGSETVDCFGRKSYQSAVFQDF